MKLATVCLWLRQNLPALFEALKGGINMSLLLSVAEWGIIFFLSALVIASFKRGREFKDQSNLEESIKWWSYRVVTPVSIGVPVWFFAVTLLWPQTLTGFILGWSIFFALVYTSARWHIESCWWINEKETSGVVSGWKGLLGASNLDRKFQYIPCRIFNIVRVRRDRVRKEFLFGVATGGKADGEFLNRMLLAKVGAVFKYSLVDLKKAIGPYAVSDKEKDEEGKVKAEQALERLEEDVQDIFETTFLDVFQTKTYDESLGKRNEICGKVAEALKKPLGKMGVELVGKIALPEIEIDPRLYEALNRMSLVDFENKEVFQKVEVGKKIGFKLTDVKGIKSSIKSFAFQERRLKGIKDRISEAKTEKTVVVGEKLELYKGRNEFKKILIIALPVIIILLGMAVAWVGYSRFSPANSPKQEASVESVVPSVNTTTPANPSGPTNGTIDSPFSGYHIPGFLEGFLFWGAVLFLVVVVIAGFSKKIPQTHWLKKHRMPIIGTCFMIMFFGIFAQALPGIGGIAVLVMVISLMIATSIRKDKILEGIFGLVILYLIISILIVPFISYTMEIQYPKFYKEQIKSGKAWEDFKKLFQGQASNQVSRVSTQSVVKPKKAKKVVEFYRPTEAEKPKVIENPKPLVPKKITIPVLGYVDGDWDEYGIGWNYARESSDEIWGRKVGYISYAFRLGKVSDYVLTVRLSSELENTTSSRKKDSSDVTLNVNGGEIGTKNVIADDASGRVYSWQIPVSCLKVGENTISFVVNENGYRNGLVIYTRYPIRLEPI